MGWDNEFVTIITLPAGATTGARIVIDGTTDQILMYDGTGQLIASIAASDGTDAAGNTVLEGVTTYSGQEYVRLDVGSLLIGVDLVGAQAGTVGVIGDSSGILVGSATNASLPNGSNLTFKAGTNGATTGQAAMPHLELNATNGADFWILGTLLHGFLSGGTMQPESWQTPSAAANWSIGTLQYRRDPLDNVIWDGTISYTGTAVTAAGAQTVLGTAVPAAYRPTSSKKIVLNHFTSTGVSKNVNASATINSSGLVSIQWGDGMASTSHDANGLANGDVFEFRSAVPLGNIP